MARSKKEPVEVREEDLEALDETIDSLEDEIIDSDVIESDDDEAQEKPTPKAKSKRKPRARKAPTAPTLSEPDDDAITSEPNRAPLESEEETVVSGTEILNAAPVKKAPTQREKVAEQTPIAAPPSADHLREDAAIASAGLEKSMESMAKQWVSIQEISGSICTSLERVSEMLHEIPAQMEAMRPPTTRPAPITKIAVGMSGFAILLSILSISFSQSVRQSVLNADNAPARPAARVARIASSKPVAPPPVVNEAPVAPKIDPKAESKPAPELVLPKLEAPKATPKQAFVEQTKALPKASPVVPSVAKEEKRSDLKIQIEKAEAKLAAETAAKARRKASKPRR